MEDQLKQILESLPEKPPRSRLAPYREFIEELRRLGRTYREIATILAEKCQLNVSASAIHDFFRLHSSRQARRGSPISKPQRSTVEAARLHAGTSVKGNSEVGVQDRIAALKRRDKVTRLGREIFQFDASEPLRLDRSRKE